MSIRGNFLKFASVPVVAETRASQPWPNNGLLRLSGITSRYIHFVLIAQSLIATGYALDCRGSIPDMGKIFLFSVASEPVLEPTQPPIQWVPWATSSRGQRGRGMKLTRQLYLLPRSRIVELHLHSPEYLHGTVLN
jgi:hypothetical protein